MTAVVFIPGSGKSPSSVGRSPPSAATTFRRMVNDSDPLQAEHVTSNPSASPGGENWVVAQAVPSSWSASVNTSMLQSPSAACSRERSMAHSKSATASSGPMWAAVCQSSSASSNPS